MIHFVLRGKSCIFAPLEPAKPLNDAQIGGSFFYYTSMDKKRIYYRLCIIRYFLSSISPNNNFNEKLLELLTNFPSVDIAAMGFNKEWKDEDLWK